MSKTSKANRKSGGKKQAVEPEAPTAAAEGPAGQDLVDGATVADVVNELHRAAYIHAETAVENACKCGGLLLDQKASMKHGEWKAWVEDNCDFKYNTASRYMKAATQKIHGVDFSTLSQLYGPQSDAKPEKASADDKLRDVLPPASETENDINELNIGLEKIQLPMRSPESFIDQAGIGFFTDKANENLEWLVRLYDMLVSLTPQEDA
jgi:hypothetical protein